MLVASRVGYLELSLIVVKSAFVLECLVLFLHFAYVFGSYFALIFIFVSCRVNNLVQNGVDSTCSLQRIRSYVIFAQ